MIHSLAQLEPPARDAVAPSSANLLSVIAPYMGVFFAAFFVAIIITPIMRYTATRNGVVDWPDLKRKNHLQPVAYLGGVAIFLGWLVGVSLCYFMAPPAASNGAVYTAVVNFPLSIILGAAAITLTGLFDDVYGISPRVKVGGQLFGAAALANEAVGLQLVESSISLMGLPEMPAWVVYLLGTAVIAGFVLGGCNATNLLDGMDGLAAGVTGIAAMGFLIIAGILVLRGIDDPATANAWDPIRVVMCLAILGAVLGFLPYNFNPATIFMGDAGSLLLGYLSVTTILMFAGAPNGLLVVTAALIVFALPVADTTLAIIRRKVQGRPIFSPDSQHIHHLLRRSGLSVKQATLLLYALAVCFAVLGAGLVWAELRWRYVLAVFFVLYGFIFVTAYKYAQLQQYQQRKRQRKQAAAASAPTRQPPSAKVEANAEPSQTNGARKPAGPPL